MLRDLRHSLRTLTRDRGWTAVVVVSLALGIGANAALFQVVDAVRLQSLPVADPSSLVEVRIADMDGERGSFETWHSAVTFPIWREIVARQQAFSGVFAWGSDRFTLTSGGPSSLGCAKYQRNPSNAIATARPTISSTNRRSGIIIASTCTPTTRQRPAATSFFKVMRGSAARRAPTRPAGSA